MAGKGRHVEIIRLLYESQPTTAKYMSNEFEIDLKSMYHPLKKLRKNGLNQRLNMEVVKNTPYGLTDDGVDLIERIDEMNLLVVNE